MLQGTVAIFQELCILYLWLAFELHCKKSAYTHLLKSPMKPLSNLDLIRRVPLFTILNAQQTKILGDAVSKRRFKRGEVIVEQGKKSHSLYIILAGRARVVMADSQNREVILATLRVGDYIGEMSMIDGQAHSATVQAEIHTDVLELGREAFTQCLRENVSITDAVMCGLVERLRLANKKISSLALMGVYGRVATHLLASVVPGKNGELQTQEKMSRQDIAKTVGASREMVSRVMKDLEDQGFIQTLDNGALRIFERRLKPR
jgi:CRP-like cAMP-binding protein